ncbi:MAG: HAD hydrolase family protein [Planctomycetes bacterium]|nr:HAD hydrolase family protein [Planctomycetota bacterium]
MADIRCVVLDVDGVLTDGRLYCGERDEPLRAFHVHDGLAIHWLEKLDLTPVILTGKSSTGVEARAAELGIPHVIQGSRDKLADLKTLLAKLGLELDQVAMVGDDLPDLPVLQACGYPIAVANAVPEVKAAARYVTGKPGGDGAVREALEHLLRSDGRWERILAHYSAAAAART